MLLDNVAEHHDRLYGRDGLLERLRWPTPNRGRPVGELALGCGGWTPGRAAIAPLADSRLSPSHRTARASRSARWTRAPTPADSVAVERPRNVTTRLTSDPMNDAGALWSPDGARIVFRSNRIRLQKHGYSKGVDDVRSGGIASSTALQQLGPRSTASHAHYSRDGRHILLTNTGSSPRRSTCGTCRPSPACPRVILDTAFDEYHGALYAWMAAGWPTCPRSRVPRRYTSSRSRMARSSSRSRHEGARSRNGVVTATSCISFGRSDVMAAPVVRPRLSRRRAGRAVPNPCPRLATLPQAHSRRRPTAAVSRQQRPGRHDRLPFTSSSIGARCCRRAGTDI